jgi:CheY-like chemotaxis protein
MFSGRRDFTRHHACATIVLTMPFRVRVAPIVLLEDDPLDASFVKLALTTARIRNPLHNFDSVAAIRTFLSSTFADERPVLFILDFHVSGPETGLDFLRWLRQQESPMGSTPALMLTGSDRPEDRDECLGLGSTSFLKKPVTETTLTDAVQALGFVIVTSLTSGEVGFRIIERRDAPL